MDLRAIRPDEVDGYLDAVATAFHVDLAPHDRERWRAPLEPARSIAAFDEGRIVGTASAFTRRMVVPGGALVPAAHVTLVGVRPTHRRRGLLTAVLGEVHAAAPEPFAVLWASEAPIYGRFGYGPAGRRAELRVTTARAALRSDVPPAVPVRLVTPPEAEGVARAVHAAALGAVPGMPDREAPPWWARVLADPEAERDGASSLRAAVLEDERGYVLYAIKPAWASEGPAHTCVVRELVAVDAAARAGLWRFLLSLDLVAAVTWEMAPADEPLVHQLADPRAATVRLSDALWVALLDVPGALGARAYAGPIDLVLDVEGTGTVRLRAGTGGETSCAAAPHAPADLRLGREALGAAYLGGTTLAQLHAAGRVEEVRPGALPAASHAFAAAREPWCPEVF